MEDNQGRDPNSPSNHATERSEPVRSRWTPKPEQILILESIFNSGMVNPPKDETVRIRKLLEKFGSVGDANVFYWFQNRRSRSRRRQRQMQASLVAGEHTSNQQAQAGGGAIQYKGGNTSIGFANSPSFVQSPSSYLAGSSSSYGVVDEDRGGESLYSFSNQMTFQELDQISGVTSILCPSETSNLHYQTAGKCKAVSLSLLFLISYFPKMEATIFVPNVIISMIRTHILPGPELTPYLRRFITVFINGLPTEIPRGPLDMTAMFGQDVMLVHSSGVPLPTNESGFLMQSLHHGESYFLVIISGA
ncbi:hypothetical protein DKX38_019710 [Salix brachista]|uniref:Homeobox domain-containing protein n=1 Tax=Salix brachista TaxID=2182728 RepID=A0A5N5KH04_9ROSI|nr:hypothetical protein DKX38_019710 [Salix brachista]